MGNQDWSDIGNNISDMVQQAIDSGDYSKLSQTIQKAVTSAVNSAAEGVAEGMNGATKGFKDGMNGAAKEFRSGMSGAAEEFGRGMHEGAENFGKGMNSTAESFGRGINNAADEFGKSMNSAADSFSRGMSSLGIPLTAQRTEWREEPEAPGRGRRIRGRAPDTLKRGYLYINGQQICRTTSCIPAAGERK